MTRAPRDSCWESSPADIMIETKSELVGQCLTIAYLGCNDTFPYSDITITGSASAL